MNGRVAGGTKVFDVDVDRSAPRWSDSEYELLYADTLDAVRFRAMYSDTLNNSMIDGRNMHWKTDIGA